MGKKMPSRNATKTICTRIFLVVRQACLHMHIMLRNFYQNLSIFQTNIHSDIILLYLLTISYESIPSCFYGNDLLDTKCCRPYILSPPHIYAGGMLSIRYVSWIDLIGCDIFHCQVEIQISIFVHFVDLHFNGH